MSKLTAEQYEQLPDFLKNDYVQDGEGYSHAGMLKVKSTADGLDKQSKATAAELAEYKKQEAERIAEAERKAYEKAMSEGKTEEVEKRLTQKIADAEKRASESEAQFKQRMAKLADKQKKALAAQLAAKYAVKGGEAAYEMLVSRYIEIDPETDEVTFLDDSSRATSLKQADFELELKKNSLLMPLTKADIATENGGNANGSSKPSGSAANLKFEEMSGADLVALLKEDPQKYNQLKAAYYNQ